MTEYLVELLQHNFKLATLSRGYRRKTRGFTTANESTTALDIGDEPMQFYKKYPRLTVAVGEERIVAVPLILQEHPEIDAIILDDALQHRKIEAGLNILLTDYNNLFVRDKMFPVGELRDEKASARRANIIVVTKADPHLSYTEKEKIIKEISPLSFQKLFFSANDYAVPEHIYSHEKLVGMHETHCLAISGIADPKPFYSYVNATADSVSELTYKDHHIFSSRDLDTIKTTFDKIDKKSKIILTTQKDAMRLLKFKEELRDFPIYALPVKHKFLFNEGEAFDDAVVKFLTTFVYND